MSGRFLLDTNIVIALFAGDVNVISVIAKASNIFIPSIVIGELWYGIQKSIYREKNIARLEDFVSFTKIVSVDQNIAQYYGEIKNDLRAKGHSVPENDIWFVSYI